MAPSRRAEAHPASAGRGLAAGGDAFPTACPIGSRTGGGNPKLSVGIAALAGVLVCGIAGQAAAQTGGPRFPELTRDQMTEAQKRIYDAIASGPRSGVRGPFGTLLRSPELTDRVQRLGEYLRFQTSFPARLNEFAILIHARFWESKYEWNAHRPLARKGGLAESILDDLAQNQRPANMRPDEEVVYDFCATLHRKHFVEDGLFHRAVTTLGEQGVVDLIGVSGYYTLVSMVLNVAEVPLPAGAKSPW